MKIFDYNAYISSPPKYVRWLSDDEFEVVVGTKRICHKDVMDNAGQHILKNIKFHLNKKYACCIAKGIKEENFYLTDEEDIKLEIVMNNIDDFFQNYEFTPEDFCSFIRFLMRPISSIDRVVAKMKKNNKKTYRYA